MEAEPVAIPDPAFTSSTQPQFAIMGPDWKKPVFFTGTRLIDPQAATEPDANRNTIVIAPGQTWVTGFSLRPIVKLAAHGEYRLESMLAWQNVKVQSQAATFRIGPLMPASIALGFGVRPFDAGEGEGALLQRGEKGIALYSFEFHEMRPGIGEAMLNPAIFRAVTGAGATDVAVPQRNSPFFNELLRWILWREGRTAEGNRQHWRGRGFGGIAGRAGPVGAASAQDHGRTDRGTDSIQR